MQRILVPTDFSDNALKAACYAGEIATGNQAAVYLLHAMELGIDKLRQPFTLPEQYTHPLREERKNKLETLRKNFSEMYPAIRVEAALEDGTAVDSILDFCSFKNIDLVVMGTKGAGGLKEKWVGTVTASLVAKTIVPVLAVPEDYLPEKPDAILFATHRFEQNKKLLAMIMELATLFTARVDVVYFDDVESAQRKTINEQARHMAAYIHFLEKNYKPVSFKGEILEGNDFETAIETYHASHKTDIAAMITYPKGFWEKVFQKSVTRKMVYHSTVPVLAIPAV